MQQNNSQNVFLQTQVKKLLIVVTDSTCMDDNVFQLVYTSCTIIRTHAHSTHTNVQMHVNLCSER